MARKSKKANINLRYNILTVLIYVLGIILIARLFNLQIVHGAEYREESNTRLTRAPASAIGMALIITAVTVVVVHEKKKESES